MLLSFENTPAGWWRYVWWSCTVLNIWYKRLASAHFFCWQITIKQLSLAFQKRVYKWPRVIVNTLHICSDNDMQKDSWFCGISIYIILHGIEIRWCGILIWVISISLSTKRFTGNVIRCVILRNISSKGSEYYY